MQELPHGALHIVRSHVDETVPYVLVPRWHHISVFLFKPSSERRFASRADPMVGFTNTIPPETPGKASRHVAAGSDVTPHCKTNLASSTTSDRSRANSINLMSHETAASPLTLPNASLPQLPSALFMTLGAMRSFGAPRNPQATAIIISTSQRGLECRSGRTIPQSERGCLLNPT